jgi:uncharacterized protein
MIDYSFETTSGLRIVKADSFFLRARGLLGQKRMDRYDGILLTNCNSIHTYFMCFPIDLIFLNERHECLRLIESVKPWSSAKDSRAIHVLELRIGTGVKLFRQNQSLNSLSKN